MKIILIFLLSIFSLNCFAAEHMTIGGFELVTKLPDKLFKSSECNDFYNYIECNLDQKDQNYKLFLDKESHVIVSVTQIRNYPEASNFKCLGYHDQMSDVLSNVFNGKERKISRTSSAFNIKYLKYEYTVFSKCIDSKSYMVSIYLADFYSELLKMKAKEYQEGSKDLRVEVLKDLGIELK